MLVGVRPMLDHLFLQRVSRITFVCFDTQLDVSKGIEPVRNYLAIPEIYFSGLIEKLVNAGYFPYY